MRDKSNASAVVSSSATKHFPVGTIVPKDSFVVGSISRHTSETLNLLSGREGHPVRGGLDPNGRFIMEFKLGRKRKHHKRIREIWSFDLEGERRYEKAMSKMADSGIEKQQKEAQKKKEKIRRFPRGIRFPRLPGIINGKKVDEKTIKK